jgi:hypothetical protein
MADISNSDDIIDSREIEERIEELESEILNWRASLNFGDDETPSELCEFATWDDAQDFLTSALAQLDGDADADRLYDLVNVADEGKPLTANAGRFDVTIEPYKVEDDDDEREELRTLKELRDELEPYAPDWHHGETLIRETYFTKYCEELCKDIGAIPEDTPDWIVIDWEATANNMRVDYTEAEFDGVTYLIR